MKQYTVSGLLPHGATLVYICFTAERAHGNAVDFMRSARCREIEVRSEDMPLYVRYFSSELIDFNPEGLVECGEVPVHYGLPDRYYCAPENKEEAEKAVARMAAEEKKRLDDYYSQPWV